MLDGAEIRDAGPKPVLAWLPVTELSVDDRYQRDLESRASKTLIRSIVDNFQWAAFGVVVVVKHGAGWRIIDGQHRTEAARQRGEVAVPCVVIEAMSVEDQARIFVRANRDRVAMNPFAMHHAQLAALDPGALQLRTMCEIAGLSIPRYPVMVPRLKSGQTLALATLTKILRVMGREKADLAVGAVAAAYRNDPAALKAVLFKAVAAIVAAADDAEDAATKIADYLSRTSSSLLFRTALAEMTSLDVNGQMALERVVKRGMTGRPVVAMVRQAPAAPPQGAVKPLDIKPLLPDGRPLPESPSQVLDRKAYDEDRFRRLVRSGAPAARIAAAFQISEAEVRRRSALLNP